MIKPRNKIKNQTKVTFFIGKDLKQLLKEKAFRTNRTMGSIVREALRDTVFGSVEEATISTRTGLESLKKK